MSFCVKKKITTHILLVLASTCYGGDFINQLSKDVISPVLGEKKPLTENQQPVKPPKNINPKSQQLQSKMVDANEFPSTLKALDWSAVPSDFMADFKSSDFTISAYFAGHSIGDFNVRVISDHQLKIDLQKVFHSIKLKPAVKRYFEGLFRDGMIINKIIYCNPSLQSQGICKGSKPVFLANLDLDNLSLKFYVDRSLFANQNSGGIEYLEDPYQRYWSSVFKYNFNIAQNYGNAENNSTTSLSIDNVTGFGKTHMDTSGYFSYSDDDSDATLSQLQVIHDFKRTSLALGYNDSASVFSSNALNLTYGYNGGMLGAAWYSTTNMMQNKGSSSINPIMIFLNQQATVRVYRNNQLLTVQNYGIGSHEIDTTSFPSGVYPVRIEIYNGAQLIRTETQMINKPFSSSDLAPDNSWAFATWAGIAQNYNASTFTLPYIGSSIKGILGRYVMGQLASYLVGSLSVYEVDATVSLPYSVDITASAGHDSEGGYGANVTIDKVFTDWLSTNVYYNQTGKSIERSPFSFDQSQVGASVSLGFGFMGNLSVNGSYDFREDQQNYYATYSVTLLQRYGFFLTGNVYTTWQSQDPDSNQRAFDYSIGLTLTYNFDNGSSIDFNSTYHPYTSASENNVSFNPALDSTDFVSSFDIGASYNHDPDATVDTKNAYTDIGFTQRWLQGNLNAQANFADENTQSISGSLQGSFVVNHNGFAASNDQGDSGLLVDLPGAPNADMNMVVNGSFYPVHGGANFIPLPAYQPYHAYLLQGNDVSQNLMWKHFDDDFVLYPGNIYPTSRHITPVIQVLGQVKSSGNPLAYGAVHNQVDKTVTDENGFFSINIDPANPVIQIDQTPQKACTYMLTKKQLADLHQGSWLGEINCDDHMMGNNHKSSTTSTKISKSAGDKTQQPQVGEF